MRTLIVTLSLVGVAAAACGGSQPSAQAPAVPAAPEKTLFTDAPAYASQAVAASAAAAHAAKKLAVPGKDTACLTCHKAGGTAPEYAFAGTVYADGDGKKGAPDIEVRVVDGAGSATSVHSDADGNFWVKGALLQGPIHSGARSATKTRIMKQAVKTADCNSCHNADIPMILSPGT
jgi:cytochrome c553